MPLQLEILTPNQVVLRDKVDGVVAPSTMGEVGLLPQHTDYLTQLEEGTLKVIKADKTQEFKIRGGGLCRIASDNVIILVDEVTDAQ